MRSKNLWFFVTRSLLGLLVGVGLTLKNVSLSPLFRLILLHAVKPLQYDSVFFLRERGKKTEIAVGSSKKCFFKQAEDSHPPFSPPQDNVTIMHLSGEYPKRLASHTYNELCLEALR
jgi:hypothetical protein